MSGLKLNVFKRKAVVNLHLGIQSNIEDSTQSALLEDFTEDTVMTNPTTEYMQLRELDVANQTVENQSASYLIGKPDPVGISAESTTTDLSACFTEHQESQPCSDQQISCSRDIGKSGEVGETDNTEVLKIKPIFRQRIQPPAVVIVRQPSIARPPTYLALSVLTCLFCCFYPTGIMAMYYSYKTSDLSARGKMLEAYRSASLVKFLSFITAVLGLFIYAFLIVFMVGFRDTVFDHERKRLSWLSVYIFGQRTGYRQSLYLSSHWRYMYSDGINNVHIEYVAHIIQSLLNKTGRKLCHIDIGLVPMCIITADITMLNIVCPSVRLRIKSCYYIWLRQSAGNIKVCSDRRSKLGNIQ